MATTQDIKLEDWDPEIWLARDPRQAITNLFAHVESNAARSIEWYERKKGSKVWSSWLLRFGAIVGGILGGLAPIVSGFHLTKVDPQTVSQIGYILIALAAGFVAADKYFGFSSGWIRYITALLTLQHSLADFRLDWSSLLLATRDMPLDAAALQRFVERARQFQDEILRVVEQETQAWVTEFQTNLADLEKTLTAQKEAARVAKEAADKASAVGAVTITLSAKPQGPTEVRVDGQSRGSYDGQQIGLPNIAPGLRAIGVKGVRPDGSAFDHTAVASVKVGEIETLAFTL